METISHIRCTYKVVRQCASACGSANAPFWWTVSNTRYSNGEFPLCVAVGGWLGALSLWKSSDRIRNGAAIHLIKKRTIFRHWILCYTILLTCMDSYVIRQMLLPSERLGTEMALVRRLTSVLSNVVIQVLLPRKRFCTVSALVRGFPCVLPDVVH